MKRLSSGDIRNDAWVLLAILYAGRRKGADLPGILAAADFVSHGILMLEELESGLSRLLLAGWIEQRKSKFHPTDITLRLYDQSAAARRRYVQQELEDVEQILAQVRPAACAAPAAAFTLPRPVYDQALRQYRDQAAAYRAKFQKIKRPS
jgi:hypothetical protein